MAREPAENALSAWTPCGVPGTDVRRWIWMYERAGSPASIGLLFGLLAVSRASAQSVTGPALAIPRAPGVRAGDRAGPRLFVVDDDRGTSGWNVLLSYSREYAPEFVPERSGWSVVEPDSPTLFVGALPLSGTLQISLPFLLAPNERAAVLHTQAKLYDTVTGTPYLAEPSALLVYRDPCP